MHGAAALVAAILIVLALTVAGAYAWHRFYGWESAEYTSGTLPEWTPKNGKPVSMLRFRNAQFSISSPAAWIDVTSQLNAMAVGYDDKATSMKLVAPLNPYSFTIARINEAISNRVAPGATATLKLEWRTL
jgi:hypothetical protein